MIKRLGALVLIFSFFSQVWGEVLTIPMGTVFHLKPVSPIDFQEVYYGKKLLFAISRDVTVNGIVVAKKGDTIDGEVMGGTKRNLGGAPDLVLIQFNTYQRGDISIPLMKFAEFRGKYGILGWVFALPTLGLTTLLPGGKLSKSKQELKVTTIASVEAQIK